MSKVGISPRFKSITQSKRSSPIRSSSPVDLEKNKTHEEAIPISKFMENPK
jgi:hypothetical protein